MLKNVIRRSGRILGGCILSVATRWDCGKVVGVTIGILGVWSPFSPGLSGEEAPPVVDLPPVTVTATRGAAAVEDVPLQVSVYEREEIADSAALTMDDFLRRSPSFSTFRRSSSLVAHPTTQGTSLRGVGPTGASRALVLLDGIPLNDPFGGWVYWSKIPMLSVERVDVVRGGGSTAWGSGAMGGVINVITRPHEPGLTVEGLAGNRGTMRANLRAGGELGPVALGLDGQYFETDGYHIVHPDQRGPIDERAFSRNRSATGTVVAPVATESSLTLRASGFAEDRGNGTPFTRNDTRSGRFSSTLDFTEFDDVQWEWTLFGEHSVFASTFSSVNSDRTEETPALDQFDVPSTMGGTAVQFWREIGDNHSLTGAVDLRWITGETNEDFFFQADDFRNRRRAGGSQALAGVFVENAYEPDDSWRFSVGARVDYWNQFDGEFRQWDRETGAVTASEDFPQRDGSVLSPRVGVVHHITEAVSVRGAAYQGFRAPTINELYRPFRVGADVTQANPDLDPERVTGLEAGSNIQFNERWHGLVTAFWSDLRDPITNVTIGESNAGGALRQRQNLDRAIVYGVELETGWKLHANWSVSGGVLLSRATVRRAPQQPKLEGNRLSQTPDRTAVLRSRWEWGEGFLLEVQGRYAGPQFEDDLNTRRLSGFWVFDLYGARQLGEGSAIFAGVENVFDRLYTVGETGDGLRTVGQPIMAHAGIRWSF